MKLLNKKKGFTLAEILSVLTILGIVAAISIPATVKRTTEKHTQVKLIKIYSTLENALQESVIHNGEITSWDIGSSNSYAGAKKVADKMLPYFNVRNRCGKASESYECFSKEYKSMIGDEESWITENNTGTVRETAILKDDVALSFWSGGKDACKNSGECFAIVVDTNGPKEPNKAGVDAFEFQIYSNGTANWLEPVSLKERCTKSSQDYMNGQGCGAWLIKKGNMDYIRREISEEEWCSVLPKDCKEEEE